MIKRMYINEEFDNDLEQLAKETTKKFQYVFLDYDLAFASDGIDKLYLGLNKRNSVISLALPIYCPSSDNSYTMQIKVNKSINGKSIKFIYNNALEINANNSNPSIEELDALQKAAYELQTIINDYKLRRNDIL